MYVEIILYLSLFPPKKEDKIDNLIIVVLIKTLIFEDLSTTAL